MSGTLIRDTWTSRWTCVKCRAEWEQAPEWRILFACTRCVPPLMPDGYPGVVWPAAKAGGE